ncbi:MAG TPA: 1,4-dihydroxy-2-naphthoate octaprenyltransferase [Dehalococcoidia bacterium]|nr:1,4-dihydroxy-2-naphthoate octaprenyltransferase [Dehalococcoidia bacterium]
MTAAGEISKRRAWWIALRPFSYPASIVPVLVGTAVAAEQEFRPLLFALALAGSVLIQAGTNLATDFFDFVDRVQPAATLGGVIQRGLISARAVHRAAIACFAAGAACGLVIVAYTGWPILAAGVASVLAGYFYTGAPIAYGRRGLGEAMVFCFMGVLMVMASAYVQVERLTWEQFFASLPVGLLVADILHANNLRDIENDRARGKITIAGVLGRPAADYVYVALTASPFGVVPACVVLGQLPPESLLSLLAAPFAVLAARALREREAAALNALVRGTAGLHMRFGLLLAAGLALRALT